MKADGSYSSFEYDPIGRPVAMVDGEGNTTRTEYDPWTGGPATVTDGLLHRTSYSYYSDWNALAPSSDPNVETNPVGTLASVVDGSGLTTLYTYNTLGQVLSESK